MMAAIGLTDHQKLKRMHINRRVFMDTVKRYDQIYPEVPVGCFNSGKCAGKLSAFIRSIN